MAYPEDNEDDLNKWLASQQSPSLSAAPSATPAGNTDTWSKARDLMQKQSAMQYSPQDYSKYLKPSEDKPDRMGGDFRTILAMALDLFGNKGRGAGQLMQAGNQMFDAKDAAWKRENGPQAMLQREQAVKGLENADRGAFNQDRAVIGDQIGREMTMAGAQQTQANNDRNFEHTQERDMAGDVQHEMDHSDTVDYQNRSLNQSKELQQEQMKQTAANAGASRAQAERHFNAQQAQHLLDQDEALNARRDQFSHADRSQNAQFEHADEMQDKSQDAQRMIHELTHPAPSAPEGYEFMDPQAARQVTGNAGLMAKIYEKSGNAKQVQTSIDRLIDLRSKPSSEANKRLYDAEIKTLIGDRSQEGSTGVLSNPEFIRYIQDLPEYGTMGNFSTFRAAADSFQGRDPAAETLKGFKERFNASNDSEFNAYSLRRKKPEQATNTSTAQTDDPYIKRYGLSLVK